MAKSTTAPTSPAPLEGRGVGCSAVVDPGPPEQPQGHGQGHDPADAGPQQAVVPDGVGHTLSVELSDHQPQEQDASGRGGHQQPTRQGLRRALLPDQLETEGAQHGEDSVDHDDPTTPHDQLGPGNVVQEMGHGRQPHRGGEEQRGDDQTDNDGVPPVGRSTPPPQGPER